MDIHFKTQMVLIRNYALLENFLDYYLQYNNIVEICLLYKNHIILPNNNEMLKLKTQNLYNI